MILETIRFEDLVELEELQRPRCDQCHKTVASVNCQMCKKILCSECNNTIHKRQITINANGEMEMLHHESIRPCNLCEACHTEQIEFLCVDCEMHLCENCCALKHIPVEDSELSDFTMHLYFCVEGSRAQMLCFSKWSDACLDKARNYRQELLNTSSSDQTIVKEELHKFASTNTEQNETEQMETEQNEAEQMETKQNEAEQMEVDNSNTTRELDNATPRDNTWMKQEPPSLPALSSNSISDVVDLTDDIESEHQGPSSIKTEPSINTSQSNTAHSTIDDTMYQGESTEDPILAVMVEEYNRLSKLIIQTDKDIGELNIKIKQLIRNNGMNEIVACRAIYETKRQNLTQYTADRQQAVANLVSYLKSDPQELEKLFSSITANVPYAVAASHRKCAQMEENILKGRALILEYKQNLENLIGIQAEQAFSKVAELGKRIEIEEKKLKEFENERLEEFTILFRFSEQIRRCVQNLRIQQST